MALPESIEKTYLPGDQVDATTLNAVQYGITANRARIEALAAPEIQWLVGKTIGDVTFVADGTATINGTARVFLDCRQAPIEEIRVHCRVDADGIDIEIMDGAMVISSASHTGDGAMWEWVSLSMAGFTPGPGSKLWLAAAVGQAQQADRVEIEFRHADGYR